VADIFIFISEPASWKSPTKFYKHKRCMEFILRVHLVTKGSGVEIDKHLWHRQINRQHSCDSAVLHLCRLLRNRIDRVVTNDRQM